MVHHQGMSLLRLRQCFKQQRDAAGVFSPTHVGNPSRFCREIPEQILEMVKHMKSGLLPQGSRRRRGRGQPPDIASPAFHCSPTENVRYDHEFRGGYLRWLDLDVTRWHAATTLK